MARKQSIKRIAQKFVCETGKIEGFVKTVSDLKMSKEYKSWSYDYAIIRLYREFEQMMLSAIVGVINRNTETIYESTGVKFPKQMNRGACEYLVIGNGYFDFKGRAGLIKILKEYMPKGHYLPKIVGDGKYKGTIEKLSALRNYATHGSKKSKDAAIKAVDAKKIGTAGNWLNVDSRFENICSKLKELAKEIKNREPSIS